MEKETKSVIAAPVLPCDKATALKLLKRFARKNWQRISYMVLHIMHPNTERPLLAITT